MTASGGRPGRRSATLRCRSCWMCRAPPKARCPATATAGARSSTSNARRWRRWPGAWTPAATISPSTPFPRLKRDRVYLQCAKRFGEPMSDAVEARIAAPEAGVLHPPWRRDPPCHRAACRAQARKRRLLLVITDGKPNDLDHYEGRHGIEDSRKAMLEARRMGHAVFGITVDRDGKVLVSAHLRPGRLCADPASRKADAGAAADLPAAGRAHDGRGARARSTTCPAI